MMSVDVGVTAERSFVAEMLSKSDSPHRLLESLSSALSASGNTALPDWKLATERKPDSCYVSCIFYNGKPLLPPRLSESERTEMASIRDRAVLVEKQIAQRKADAMRRLLGYVDQRIKQIECRKTTKPRLVGNSDERNQVGGHLTDERNYNQEPDSREIDDLQQDSPVSCKTTPSSVTSIAISRNLPENQSHVDTNVAMTSSLNDPSLTSSLNDPSMTSHLSSLVNANENKMTSQQLATQPGQTLPVPTTTVSYPLSYFSPSQSRKIRVSPRRRLNLDGSTDWQYEKIVFASTSPLAAPLIPHSAKLYAIARGHLTRKLYGSKKVRQLAATIADLSAFLRNSSPVSKHTHDAVLVDQVRSQLQAARSAVHSIFFVYGPHEQVALIAQSRRHISKDNEFRQSSVEPTTHLSVATQRSRERRERLKTKTVQSTKHQPAVKQATPSVPSHIVRPTFKPNSIKAKATPQRTSRTVEKATPSSKQTSTSARKEKTTKTWK